MPRVGGNITVTVGEDNLHASGSWSWQIGEEEREAALSTVEAVGYVSKPVAAMIEGEFLHVDDKQDIAKLLSFDDGTVSLELPNGALVVLRNAWSRGTGEGATETGAIGVRFEAPHGEII